MTAPHWLVVGLSAWILLGLALAFPVGRALHRNRHAHGDLVSDDCPAWCLRERAARLLRERR